VGSSRGSVSVGPRDPLNVLRSRGRTVVGLDLAGAPHRATGCCVLRTRRSLDVCVLGTDRAIEELVRRTEPALVVIDAPLSLPRGRASIEDRTGPHFRECDRELRRLGIRFFPLTLGPMRMLTVRGMRIAGRLRRSGFRVLEGYPGGSQDVLGIPRKGAGVAALQARLRREGFGGPLRTRNLTHDELDAVTIAWVGQLFLQGRGRLIGDPAEGVMVLPQRSSPSDPS
jgi:uncharacterized protein